MPRKASKPLEARTFAAPVEPFNKSDILRYVLDSTADGIVVADADGKFLLFNPAAEQMIGIGLTDAAPEEWSARYGCFLMDGVTPVPTEQLPLARAIRGESVDDYELMIRNPARPEGVYLSCQARPLRDGKGRLAGGVVSFRDVTEKKKAEVQISDLNAELKRYGRDHETRYRLATANRRDLIWDWNMVTSQIHRVELQVPLDSPADERVGDLDWWSKRLHREDRKRVVDGLRHVIESGEHTWSDEYRFACRDGSYAVIVDRGHVIRDGSGRPVRMVGAMIDVTDRKRSEDALAHSLDVLEATLDSTADGILVVDEHAKIVSFNRKFAAMWQIPTDVLATRDDNLLLESALRLVKNPDQFRAKVRELYANPQETSFDVLELTDGRVFERYSQARQFGGKSIGRVWSFRDVTQRHRAEQMLQEEQEFLKAVLENCAEGIVACDASGHMTLLNRAMRELYKLPAEFMPADDWREYPIYQPDGKTRLDPEDLPLLRALRGEHVRDEEIVTIDNDGNRKKLRVSGNAIILPENRRGGAVLVLHDVTEQERLQRQLLQSQKLESIGTLAGGIAHDFNNLLAVMMGNASVLLRDKTLPAKVRDLLKDILDAAERGSSLTQQLLVYARGGLQRLGPSDLNAIIDSVLTMLRRTSPPQIEFVTELNQDLPAIYADPSQIEQVMMNLCLNAVQASHPPTRIIIRTARDTLDAQRAGLLEVTAGAYARLEVQDSGCGMDSATAERIFEPFYTTKFAGRGMGLAATLGIVNSHHGQIRAESQLGKGTLMTVWLPLAEERSPARGRPSGSRRLSTPTGAETILVVDDDAAVSKTVDQILSSLGYCVVVRNEVETAVSFLETNAEDVDLVVLDLNMPRVSSEQLYRQIHERCKGAPIILASGLDSPQIQGAATSWHAAGFLQKPFSLGALAQTVRRALDGRPSQA